MRLYALLLVAIPCVAQEVIAWERTPEEFAHRWVSVRTREGQRVEGRWAGITEDAVTVAGKRDRVTVSRASIVSVRARRQQVRGRVIGTVGGLYAGMAAALRSPTPGVARVVGPVVLAAGIGLGWLWDRDSREYVLQKRGGAAGAPE